MPDDRRQGDREDEGSWLDSHPMRGMGQGPAAVPGNMVCDVQRDKVLAGLGLTPHPEQQKPAPRRFGRYIVLDVLGQGGMGTVLKGYDEELNRQVAIKVLHSDPTERERRRLKREAQALARLAHTNVVPVFEVAEAEGQIFVAMELVEGKTLRDWQDTEPQRGWKECVEAYLQAGRGLAAAHARGLVHRDFKPDNAIIDDEGRVRVLDFGLVRSVVPDGKVELSGGDTKGMLDPKDDALGSTLTWTGQAMGTIAYMPLEQHDGKPADARSDQFSFCVSLYEAVYGERPFEGSSRAALAVSIGDGRVRSAPEGTEVPTKLRAILLRGLMADARARWPSLEDLLSELRPLVAPKTRRWLRLSFAGGMAAISLGIVQYREVGHRCLGAQMQLTEIWNESRRQGVQAAILGTGLVYAPSTWERIETRLDDYARAWVDKHTEVCEATRMSAAQSEDAMELRMDCLDTRRTALNAAVMVLIRADERVVERAVHLVAGLPGHAACDDVGRLLLQRQRVPLPEDPQVAQEVEALREWLASIEAMQEVGNYVQALQEVESIVKRAEKTGYAPLLVEVKLRRGRLRVEIGRHDDGVKDLVEAHEQAVRQEHDEAALNAVRNLTMVAGDRQEELAEGIVWGQMALPLAKRIGEATKEAAILDHLGSIYERQGKLAEIEENTEEAGVNHEKAERQYREALDVWERAGADHPDIGMGMNNLGAVLAKQGKYKEAESVYWRALEIWEHTLGADHPSVAYALMGLTEVGLAKRGIKGVHEYVERAISVLREDPEKLAPARFVLARFLWDDETQRSHARQLAEQVRSAYAKAGGAKQYDLAEIEKWLAEHR